MRKRAYRSRAWIALHPPGARINLVQAPLRVQHSSAVLVIFLLQHAPSSDGHPYEVMWRAEACTATRAQDYHFIPQQVEPLSLTFSRRPHSLAALVISSRHVADLDSLVYRVSRHAEACTTARAHVQRSIFLELELARFKLYSECRVCART